jgi:hypothetical protein
MMTTQDKADRDAARTNEKIRDRVSMTGDDERARKRVAIGLAPQRPTAKATPQRPPDEPGSSIWRWWTVFLLTAVGGATVLLIVARALNSPTDWTSVRQNLTAWFSGQRPIGTLNSRGYRLQVADEFNGNSRWLAAQQQPEQWRMNVLPKEGVYRMEVWPDHVAWSTLGAQIPATFRLEAAFTLVSEASDGYAGLMGRYQNPDNFYFFVVDGQGHFQAQLRKAGVLYSLLPWTELASLRHDGQNNVMALEDNNLVMSLYINNVLVFEVLDIQLPPGQAGVIGGASNHSLAQINVDWLKLYSLPK